MGKRSRNPIENDIDDEHFVYIAFSEFGVDMQDSKDIFTFFNYLDEDKEVAARKALENVLIKAKIHLRWLDEGDTSYIRQYDYKTKGKR